MTIMQRAQQILVSRFGMDSFRKGQASVLESVLSRHDTMAVMPTGGGKSLCYQLPALYFNGLVIVVSPLIALMKDQVDALRNNGVEAAFLNSTQSGQQQAEVFRLINWDEFSASVVTLPIDKIVADLVKTNH